MAMDEREVVLFEAALGKHLAKFAVRAVVLCDEDDAAGLLVEPMDDAGAQLAANFRKLAKVEQQCVYQRAAVSRIVMCAPEPAWTIIPAGLLTTARYWSS